MECNRSYLDPFRDHFGISGPGTFPRHSEYPDPGSRRWGESTGGKCEEQEQYFELQVPEDLENADWGGDPIVLGTLHVPAKPCKVLLGNEGRPLIRDKEQRAPDARGRSMRQ